jgi:hypothetical protein
LKNSSDVNADKISVLGSSPRRCEGEHYPAHLSAFGALGPDLGTDFAHQEWLGPLHTATEVGPRPAPWRDECGLTEVTFRFSNHSSRFVVRVVAIFLRRIRLAIATDAAREYFLLGRPQYMDCQIRLWCLSLVGPIYRMGLGPAINNGLPTSACESCLDALIRSLKRPGLRDGFRASQPCEVCERPVYDLKDSKVTRVVC